MRAAGLIAAAGASSRMGMPKALLHFSQGYVFVQRLAEVFVAAGLEPVVVTVNEDDVADIEAQLAHLPVIVTPNERPQDGLSGSVATALARAPEAEAIVITPVDCPFADVMLVQSLLRALTVAVASAPVVDGVRGHPVAFAQPAFDLLWNAAAVGGPRAVLAALDTSASVTRDVLDVPWTDPRVCEDVNTPDDYERLFGVPPQARKLSRRP